MISNVFISDVLLLFLCKLITGFGLKLGLPLSILVILVLLSCLDVIICNLLI